MTSVLTSSFDQLVGPDRDPLVAAAAALTTHADNEPSSGALVIIVRPHTSHHQVLAGGGSSSLRAAVAAASSGHDRLWSAAPHGTTGEAPVRTLPEVLRAATEASLIHTVHIGRVDTDQGVACVALWFETPCGVATTSDRDTALAVLQAASEKSAAIATTRATTSQHSSRTTVIDLDTPANETRQFDPADPNLDSVTGVAHAERFDEELAAFQADEVNLLVIDLDDFETVRADAVDEVLRTIADRLVTGTRNTDTVGRIGDHTFGLLFGNIERSEAFHVAKRLSGVIRQPIDDITLTATIALAHQNGLIDTDELRELADEAIASGKRAGRGRLVMAA